MRNRDVFKTSSRSRNNDKENKRSSPKVGFHIRKHAKNDSHKRSHV